MTNTSYDQSLYLLQQEMDAEEYAELIAEIEETEIGFAQANQNEPLDCYQ